MWCALHLQWLFTRLEKLKAKFRTLKTDENEIKTLKTAAMLFCFVCLCLLWRFKDGASFCYCASCAGSEIFGFRKEFAY